MKWWTAAEQRLGKAVIPSILLMLVRHRGQRRQQTQLRLHPPPFQDRSLPPVGAQLLALLFRTSPLPVSLAVDAPKQSSTSLGPTLPPTLPSLGHLALEARPCPDPHNRPHPPASVGHIDNRHKRHGQTTTPAHMSLAPCGLTVLRSHWTVLVFFTASS